MTRRAMKILRARTLIALAAGLLLAAAPHVGAQSEKGRFFTNLALLERLTVEAVEEALGGLELPSEETILIVADGYNEGNGFVADALARVLSRRGFSVRKLQETAVAESSPEESTPAGSGAATGNTPKERAEAILKELAEDTESQAEGDPFAPDSTEADADSLLWPDQVAEEAEEQGTGEGEASGSGVEESGAPSTPSVEGESGGEAPPPVASPATPAKGYPPGPVLEFKVLEFGVDYPSTQRSLIFVGSPSVRRIAGVYVQLSHIMGPEGTIVDVNSGQSHWQDRLSGGSRSLAEGATYPFRKPEIPPSRLGRLVEPIVVVGIIGSLVYLFYQNQN